MTEPLPVINMLLEIEPLVLAATVSPKAITLPPSLITSRFAEPE